MSPNAPQGAPASKMNVTQAEIRKLIARELSAFPRVANMRRAG
jgi:hypothetical protein